MNVLPFSKIRKNIIVLALLLLAGGIGYRLGEHRVFGTVQNNTVSGANQVVTNKQTPANVSVDFSLFWDVWDRLFRYYIDASALDKQRMVWGAISGMVASLDDPYTTFLPPKENTDFKQDLGGTFEGIGAQLGLKDGRIIIVSPLKGNPAEKAGLRPGDYILKVNNEDTTGWTIQEAVNKIRGPRGTSVVLSILHDGDRDTSDISIVRDSILVPSVDHWIKSVSEIEEINGTDIAGKLGNTNDKVGYIHLSRFGDRTNEEWNSAVNEISEAYSNGAIKGLVFDLRNNPGGYLQGAVYVASEFIRNGTVVTQQNSDGTKEDFTADRRGRLLDIPVVVLLNQGSASASEIVAGALKDFKRATIVGEKSFGKGSVQTPQDLPGGAGLHITTGKWLLPGGSSINKEGISPDIIVEMEVAEASADAQLARAVQELLK